MQLLQDEKILVTTEHDLLVLTTHRVRYNHRRWDRAQAVSIMLEEVSSCAVGFNSRIDLLISAALALVLALFCWVQGPEYMNSFLTGALAFFFGCLFAVLISRYLVSRRKLLSIHSAWGAIVAPLLGMTFEQGQRFIHSLEAAKNARRLSQPVRPEDIAF